MEATEIRIGNLVTVDNPKYHPKLKDVILQVTGINETLGFEKEWTYGVSLEHINQLKYTYYESYSQFIKFIKPIPLSEERLLEIFGLKREDTEINDFTFPHCDYIIIHKQVDDLFAVYINGKTVLIKYIHQLQNLYFDLIGEELIIKNNG